MELLPAGKKAPQIAGLEAHGPVLAVFFKITCPVCQLTLPFLNRIHQAGALSVTGISQNDDADTQEFIQDFHIQFPVLFDREEEDFPASNAYGISTVPSLFLIEADGRIGRSFEGWSRKEMEWLGARTSVEIIRPGEKVPDWKAG